MNNFDILEIFLYVFPILQIIIVHLFFRSYLMYRNKFKFSVTDTVLPILLVGIHILSGRWLAFSLLPHYLFGIFLIGLGITLYFEKSPKQFMAGKVFSIIMKMGFVIGFALYYVIVIARILQLIRG
ncbi:DUF3397 family protein [Jeotgalibaca porci]|uniref:DUF3397 domain-containing protein n=2 Tax=Jeotgalibaca porci TaxID=1868793 RepID=A0A6G7WFU6_9LACT|nr:DUF3397 family protein [Jeotgalibaca porci]QIK51077.1 DUF3397 domain-containing protein [Jeotgalibaca porci]